MNDEQRFILAAVSRVTGYPADGFQEELEEIIAAIDSEDALSGAIRGELTTALEQLRRLPLKELQETYVAAFDLKEATGLYLTAHELGDSRDRGSSLILLQHIMADAGFETADGELADYMPALYELVAAAPDNVHLRALQRRLAVAAQRIAEHLPKGHPYLPFFVIAIRHVFGVPTEEDVRKLEQSREKTDLADMPYPLLYGMDGMARSDAGMHAMSPCKGMEV